MSGVEANLKELKEGTLRSSSGGKVKTRKQAIAIGLSQEEKNRRTMKALGDQLASYRRR